MIEFYTQNTMETRHKYLRERENDHPPLGNFVHWHIQEMQLKKKAISDELDVLPTTLNQYFKKRSLQFGVLWRLSQAMKFNLVMALGEHLNIPFETKAEKLLRIELAEKEERIKELEMEVGVYRRVLEKDL